MKVAAKRNGLPHVAVCVYQFRSYGRGVLRGIAEFVESFGPWSLLIDRLADGSRPQDQSKLGEPKKK